MMIAWGFPVRWPGSRQLPRRIEELDVVSLGPLGEHRLLRDEAVSAVRGAFVEQILGTLVPAAGLVVMVRNLPVTLRPKMEKKNVNFYNLTTQSLFRCRLPA